ncbi:hypothetical protein [Aliiglaciecola lipolytica]|uniref:Biopterin-dependent aromatic amino acid hydroxylase family profile domain-containing protein n=1 Tax=Aliiglaciecola lipolytica E3 TaxID=1127673 RepID=K6Y4Q8_9ALTE|nr:hypothetical protein [Aliiglaciecola lipolytica]GAC13232.1 hypothetical protein GLIP_0586 [Aliiglaciecola lipolytica E3]
MEALENSKWLNDAVGCKQCGDAASSRCQYRVGIVSSVSELMSIFSDVGRV